MNIFIIQTVQTQLKILVYFVRQLSRNAISMCIPIMCKIFASLKHLLKSNIIKYVNLCSSDNLKHLIAVLIYNFLVIMLCIFSFLLDVCFIVNYSVCPLPIFLQRYCSLYFIFFRFIRGHFLKGQELCIPDTYCKYLSQYFISFVYFILLSLFLSFINQLFLYYANCYCFCFIVFEFQTLLKKYFRFQEY